MGVGRARARVRVVRDLVGADKIILGTDYPFPLGDVHPFFKPGTWRRRRRRRRARDAADAGHLIEEGEYSELEKQKMLGLNACEFLGVDPATYAHE